LNFKIINQIIYSVVMILYLIFATSVETETGSAGEQPVRDNTDARRKYRHRWAVSTQPIDIFKEPHA
jgi:hypothetical protein